MPDTPGGKVPDFTGAPTVSDAQTRYMIEALQRVGLPHADELARRFGIDPDSTSEFVRYPASAAWSMLEAAARELEDPLVGLRAGVKVVPRGPLPYLLALSPSMIEGLKVLTSLAPIANDAVSLEVDPGPDGIDLLVDLDGPGRDSFTVVSYVVAVTIGKLRRTWPGVAPTGVSFVHEAIGGDGDAARALGCPVTFGAPRNGIRYPPEADRVAPAPEAAQLGEHLRIAGRRLLHRPADVPGTPATSGDGDPGGTASPAQRADLQRVLPKSIPAWRRAVQLAEQVAPSKVPVLLLGETGVGKERLAEAVHAASPRAGRPMVRLNCASLPATLAEAEMFGRERGAYTGADRAEAGRFEVADGSTLFLDEIGEMPLELQAKMLRVLEDGSFERLGDPRPRRADVRIVAATNRDLAEEVECGRFRRDLYFRLNVFPILVPPLRERLEDLMGIATDLGREIAASMGLPFEGFDAATAERFRRYAWPGNVRELRNVVSRALILASGPVLSVEIDVAPAEDELADRPLDAQMRKFIVATLDRCGWRVRGSGGAAEILGLPPSTLESRMKKLGIRRPDRSRSE